MRECKFIRCGKNIYIPPIEIWLEGWTRQRWLERYFKNPDVIRVASLDSWEWLRDKHRVTRLIEKSGNFIEEPYEKQTKKL